MNEQIRKEWHPAKNNGKTFDDYSFGSTKVVWWLGACGHEWDWMYARRIKGFGDCPYCNTTKLLKGFNDLETLHPEIAKEWSPNNKLKANEVLAKSSRDSLWLAECGHEWLASMSERFRGRNCPYCSGKRVLIGFNDLPTTNPELIEEWDYDKNTLNPTEVTSGSDKRAFWLCGFGHSYDMMIYKRKVGQGCSYCSSKRINKDNSLKSKFPKVAEMWVSSDDPKLSPDTVTWGSSKMVTWFNKKCGHSYKRSVKMMAKGSNCPFCTTSNTKLLKGFNDLETKFPEIIKEWHPTKNGKLTPSDFVAGSKKSVWWQCKKGHEFYVAIDSRTRTNTGCKSCVMNGSSAMERDLADFVRSLFIDSDNEVVLNSYKVIAPKELDIYIPSKNIAIEFNGLYWHSEKGGKDKNYHFDKWKACSDLGIQLITIWEDDWRDNRSVVESMLKHKLGFSDDVSVFARKTTFSESFDSSLIAEFLDGNHIQGYKNYTRNFSLVFDGSLVAVMSFSVRGNVAFLDRYATGVRAVGGFTKLLKASVNSLLALDVGIDRVVTFADHEVSDGGLYLSNGFSAVQELRPDYKYVYDDVRQHKFLFRKSRFEKDPLLKFDSSLTESGLAELNEISRVWDCGKTKFELLL